MRRILLVLSVAALMAAMLVASAAPAFAAPNCEAGQTQASLNASERGDLGQFFKHFEKSLDCLRGLPPGEGHEK